MLICGKAVAKKQVMQYGAASIAVALIMAVLWILEPEADSEWTGALELGDSGDMYGWVLSGYRVIPGAEGASVIEDKENRKNRESDQVERKKREIDRKYNGEWIDRGPYEENKRENGDNKRGDNNKQLHIISANWENEWKMPRYAVFEGRRELYGTSGVSYASYSASNAKNNASSARSEFFVGNWPDEARDISMYRQFNLPPIRNRDSNGINNVSFEVHKPMRKEISEKETGYYSVCKSGNWVRVCVQSWMSGAELWGILNGICCSMGLNDKINNNNNNPSFSTQSFNNTSIEVLFKDILSEHRNEPQADNNIGDYSWDMVNFRMNQGSVIMIDMKVESETFNKIEGGTLAVDYYVSLTNIEEVNLNDCDCYDKRNYKQVPQCLAECQGKIQNKADLGPCRERVLEHEWARWLFFRDYNSGCVYMCSSAEGGSSPISYDNLQKYLNVDISGMGVKSRQGIGGDQFDFMGEDWKRSYNSNPYEMHKVGSQDIDMLCGTSGEDQEWAPNRYAGSACGEKFNMGRMRHVEVNGHCVMADTSNYHVSLLSYESKDMFACNSFTATEMVFKADTVDGYGNVCDGFFLKGSHRSQPLLEELVCNVPCSENICTEYMNYGKVTSISWLGDCYTFEMSSQLPVKIDNMVDTYYCPVTEKDRGFYTSGTVLELGECSNEIGTSVMGGHIGKNYVCTEPCIRCDIPLSEVVVALKGELCSPKLRPSVTNSSEDFWVNSRDLQKVFKTKCTFDESFVLSYSARLYGNACENSSIDWEMIGQEGNTPRLSNVKCSKECSNDMISPTTTRTTTTTTVTTTSTTTTTTTTPIATTTSTMTTTTTITTQATTAAATTTHAETTTITITTTPVLTTETTMNTTSSLNSTETTTSYEISTTPGNLFMAGRLSVCQSQCDILSRWAGYDVNRGLCECLTEKKVVADIDPTRHEGDSWKSIEFRKCVDYNLPCPGDYLMSRNYNESLKRCHKGRSLSTAEETVDINVCGGLDLFMSGCTNGICKVNLMVGASPLVRPVSVNGRDVYLNEQDFGVARVGIDLPLTALDVRTFSSLTCDVVKLDSCFIYKSIPVGGGTYVEVSSDVLYSAGADIKEGAKGPCWMKCISTTKTDATTSTPKTTVVTTTTVTTTTTTRATTTVSGATTQTTTITTTTTTTTTKPPPINMAITPVGIIPGYGILYNNGMLWEPDDPLLDNSVYFARRIGNRTAMSLFSQFTVYKGTLDCRQNGNRVPCFDDVVCWSHNNRVVCMDDVAIGYSNITLKIKDTNAANRERHVFPYRKITFSPIYAHIEKFETMCMTINKVSIVNKFGWFGGLYDRRRSPHVTFINNTYSFSNCTMMSIEYGGDAVIRDYDGKKELNELKLSFNKEEFCKTATDRLGYCKFGEIYYDKDWKWWHVPKPYSRIRFNNIGYEYNTGSSYCENGVGNVIPEDFMPTNMCKDVTKDYEETNDSIDWSLIILAYMCFGGVNMFIKMARAVNHLFGGTMLLEEYLRILKMQYRGSRNEKLSSECHMDSIETSGYHSELSKGSAEFHDRRRKRYGELCENIDKIEKMAFKLYGTKYYIRRAQRFLIFYIPTYEYVGLTLQTAWLCTIGGLLYLYMWIRTRRFPRMSEVMDHEVGLNDEETVDLLDKMTPEHHEQLNSLRHREERQPIEHSANIIEASLKKDGKFLARAYKKAKKVKHIREYRKTFKFAWIMFLLFIGEVNSITISVVTDCAGNICTKSIIYTAQLETCTGCELTMDLVDHDTNANAGYFKIKVGNLEYYNKGAYDYTIPTKLVANSFAYAHDQEDCDSTCTNPYELPAGDPFSDVWWNYNKDLIQDESIMGPWYFCMGPEDVSGTFFENSGTCSGYISMSPDWSSPMFRVFDYSDTEIGGVLEIEYDWGDGVRKQTLQVTKDAETFEWDEGELDVQVPFTSFDLSGEKVGCLYDNEKTAVMEECFRNFEGYQTSSNLVKYRGEGIGTFRGYNGKKPTGVCTGGRMDNGIYCQWSYTWEGLMEPRMTDIESLGSIINPYECSSKISHEPATNEPGGLCRDGSAKTETECNSKLTRFGVKWGNKGYNYPGESTISRSNCGGRRISLMGTLKTQFDGSINHNVLKSSDLSTRMVGCYGKRNNVWIETTSDDAGMIYMKDGSLDVPSMVGTNGFVNISASAMAKHDSYNFQVCNEKNEECNVLSFVPVDRCEDYSAGNAVVGGGVQPDSDDTSWPWWYYLIIAIGIFFGILIVILIIVLIVRCASAPKSSMVINTRKKNRRHME